MKTKLLIVSAIYICLSACQKDKFTTKPQLEFKSVNSDVVGPGQQLIITLRYTDREGDIQNYLYIERNVANCIRDTIRDMQAIPADVPPNSNSQGDIIISYSYAPDFTYPGIGE